MSSSNILLLEFFPRNHIEVDYDIKQTYETNWGLCNQLLSIIDAIYFHANANFTIILDCFCCGIDTGSIIEASRLFDFQETNKNLAQFKINIVDREVIPNRISSDWLQVRVFFHWYIYFEKDFERILPCLVFHPTLHQISNEICIDYQLLEHETNCIHIRMDDDALDNWSKTNQQSKEVFKNIVMNKYISICEKYLKKNSFLILLCHTIPMQLRNYLTTNYQVIWYNKRKYLEKYNYPLGREIFGLIDLLIGSKIHGTIIGCQSPKTGWGSSFSLFLRLLTAKENQKIMFDLDFIHEPEVVYYNHNTEIQKTIRPR